MKLLWKKQKQKATLYGSEIHSVTIR